MIDEGESKRIVVSVSCKKTRSPDEPLENEVRFHNFFERSADAMSLLDPQTLRYVEVNEAAMRLLGAPDRQALCNVSPAERWPERQPDGRHSVEKAREMVELALTQGSHRFEWWSRRYDGSELPLDIVMIAVHFGERTLVSLVYRDICAQKRAECEIRFFKRSATILPCASAPRPNCARARRGYAKVRSASEQPFA